MKKVNRKYKHAVIAADVILFKLIDGKLKVLLIEMKKDPFRGMWAMPGGLVSGDEAVDDAPGRILFEKTGINNVYMEQLYTFGKIDRDPFGRVVSVAYMALVPEGVGIKKDGVNWFSINDLPELAYDHKEILETAVLRLKSKLEYTNVICNLLAKEFTMGELQKAYEIILNKEIDKRNFQKKIFLLNIVEKTDKKTSGGACRPAYLYKFKERKTKIIEIL